MSATAAASTTTTTQLQPSTPPRPLPSFLADYELHHSPPSSNDHDAPTPLPSQQQSESNPPSWPTDYRRVPPHRPVNEHLDQSQRRVYNNGGERAFLFVMFTGVRTNAALSRIWRVTGGKINDRIFHYKIGGEW